MRLLRMLGGMKGVTRGTGHCYQAAYILFDAYTGAPGLAEAGNLRLCHGIVRQTGWPHARMGHAWVELEHPTRGVVVVDGLFPDSHVPRDVYYRIGRIKHVVRYDEQEVRRLANHHGHYGPWDEVTVKAAYRQLTVHIAR